MEVGRWTFPHFPLCVLFALSRPNLTVEKPVKIGLWLSGFALLSLLGLWLEHERAKARLEAFKAQLIAKGEKLAVADHVPKLPPALSNAAPDFIAAAERLTELKPEF